MKFDISNTNGFLPKLVYNSVPLNAPTNGNNGSSVGIFRILMSIQD